MSTDDIIIGLYVRVDSMIGTLPKHPQAELFPRTLFSISQSLNSPCDGTSTIGPAYSLC